MILLRLLFLVELRTNYNIYNYISARVKFEIRRIAYPRFGSVCNIQYADKSKGESLPTRSLHIVPIDEHVSTDPAPEGRCKILKDTGAKSKDSFTVLLNL